ncbi:MAG: MFS transporter [Candidatus Verstraetearchaeota archaeon]|nr:MFS transporter [Candidatus Verstraetearchaeota archaeon]
MSEGGRVPIRFYLSVGVFSTAFGIMSPAVPLYASEVLQANEWTLGVLGAVMALPYIAGAAVFGRFSDRIGRKPLMVLGLVLYVAVTLSYISCSEFVIFGLLRCLEGLAFSMVWPSAEAYVGDRGGASSMGERVGCYSVSWSSGYTAGPFLMGAVLSLDGLQSAFLATILLVVAGLLLVLTVKMPPVELEGRVDKDGVVNGKGFLSTLYLMVVWGFAMLSFYFLFPPYAVGLGIPAPIVGYMVGCASGMRTLSFLVYERFLRRNSVVAGVIAMMTSMLLGWALPGMVGFFIMAALFGVSLGMLYAHALGRMLDQPSRGLGAGLFEASIGFGQFLGPIVMGYVGFTFGSGAIFLVLSLIAAVSIPVTRIINR